MRAFVVALSLMLGACSSTPDLEIPAYKPPSPPSAAAVAKGARQAAGEEKLKGPIEVSEVRPTDHGTGSYFFCLREANPATPKAPTYVVFYNDDTYKSSRQSVLMEGCEAQSYSPVADDKAAPAATPMPTPSPTPDGHHRRR
jgi:hypothetical protein